MPSLRDLAWKTIKCHADCYARIPDDYMFILEQSLIDFESLDEEPFAFLRVAYDLQVTNQIQKAIDYIALWVHRSSPGQKYGDVMQFTELTHTIAQLPGDIASRIWNRRNSINDRTGQFDPAPSAARAE